MESQQAIQTAQQEVGGRPLMPTWLLVPAVWPPHCVLYSKQGCCCHTLLAPSLPAAGRGAAGGARRQPRRPPRHRRRHSRQCQRSAVGGRLHGRSARHSAAQQLGGRRQGGGGISTERACRTRGRRSVLVAGGALFDDNCLASQHSIGAVQRTRGRRRGFNQLNLIAQ